MNFVISSAVQTRVAMLKNIIMFNADKKMTSFDAS